MVTPRPAEVTERVIEALARELARTENSLDALPVAYYQADESDRIVFASDELRRLVQDDVPEGQSMRAFYRRPVDRDVLLARLEREGGDATIVTEFATGARVEERAVLREVDGERRVEAVLLDITEQSRFERELERYARMLDVANRELKRSVRALDAFTYSVSHDLKTPVRGIIAYVEALEEELARAGQQLTPEAREYLDGIGRSGVLMDSMIRGLLEFARLQRLPHEGTADSARIVTDIVAALGPEIGARGAEIALGELPVVPVAHEALRAVLMNMISNALKHSDAASPHVRVGAEREDSGWTFEVRDNGSGVPREARERIFDLFYRRSPARAEGAGAGLAIARSAVDGWGGRVWVEDAPGGGSSFRFTVPDRPPRGSAPPAT